jgi:hypothetical protein
MTTNIVRTRMRYVVVVVAVCVAALGGSGCKSVRPTAEIRAVQLSVEAKQVLSWLPASTETLLTAKGPFHLPNFQVRREDYADHKLQAQELRQAFQGLTVTLFAFGNGGLRNQLEGKKILFAAEGSRSFRTPNELGELPYEGCAIVIFADDLGETQETLMKTAGKNALRIENIESHKVAVFQEKMQQDIWTTYVVFPAKNIVVVATNRDYLGEVLARMRAPGTPSSKNGNMWTRKPSSGVCDISTGANRTLIPLLRLAGRSPRIYPTNKRSVWSINATLAKT